MSCKEKLEAYLKENVVPFETHHHAVAYTAQEVAEAEQVSGKVMVKW
jgi:Ala-tRNA(Pro) deacylase